MKEVFVDTSFWIARLNPRDRLHERALATIATSGSVHFVTSELVLAELLNDFASRGAGLRRAAVQLTKLLQDHDAVTVVPATSELFAAGLSLYAARNDKSWGLTDCTSFLLMRSRGITHALTHDVHFVQAGFTALLRNQP